MPNNRRASLSLLLAALLTWGCASAPSNWAPADLGPERSQNLTELVEPGNRVEIVGFDGSRVEGWADEVHPDAVSVNDRWYHSSTIESLRVADADTTTRSLDLFVPVMVVAATLVVAALAGFSLYE